VNKIVSTYTFTEVGEQFHTIFFLFLSELNL